MKYVTPKDARPVTVRRQVGVWSTLRFDFEVIRHGLTWLHVKDGMGGRGDREDWVCDLPGLAISVHNYNWDGSWTETVVTAKTFDGACKAALRNGLSHAKSKRTELLEKLGRIEKGIGLIQKALNNHRVTHQADESHWKHEVQRTAREVRDDIISGL